MISTDNIEKFNKVVAYYQLDPAQLRDIAKAVCIADCLHGTDPQKLSPVRLNNSGIEVFNGVSAVKSNAKPLPDIQVMRVICDTLFYGIYIKHKKLIKGTRLTNACSSYVGTELQVNNSPVMRAETNEYFDMNECQRILDSFVDSCIEVSQDDKDINDFLKKLSEFNKVDFEKITLDKKYRDICTYPVKFRDLGGEDYRVSLTDYAVSYICDPKRAITYSIVVHSRLSNLKLDKRLNLIMNIHTRDMLNQNESIYKALSAGFALSMAKSGLSSESIYTLYKVIFM